MLLFPSIFLSLTVLAFIMLGDVVRDALDPRCAEEADDDVPTRTAGAPSRGPRQPAPGSRRTACCWRSTTCTSSSAPATGSPRPSTASPSTSHEGETLAILGESGSGKSVTAQAIMGILDTPPGFITGGEVRYCGPGHPRRCRDEQRRRDPRPGDLDGLPGRAVRAQPGLPRRLADRRDVPQAPRDEQADAQSRAVELMERVQIPAARQRVKAYPHQFSGGMRQRIMIAMAIALDPAVLIADEPTTALDVTVQAQIMELLAELQEERKMGLILITHDLGVVADVADRIAVMYAGRIVEQADVYELYAQPAHPYTKGLLDSIPRLDQKGEDARRDRRPAAQPDCASRRAARSIRAAITPRTSAGSTRRLRCGRSLPAALAACHFSELLLAHSPELEVTQTTDDVEALVEFDSRHIQWPLEGLITSQ